jgi:hypothetical protein
MTVKVDESGKCGELRLLTIENEHLRLGVLPGLGAKIYDIIHKKSGRNVLWHNPRIRPRKIPFGSRFDDVWSGGWDEIFPNDAESTVGSEHYPDMGELWTLDWDYSIRQSRDSVTLTTTVEAPITPARITRKLTLAAGEAFFTAEYEILNLSRDEIRFLWKLHPAFEINKHCRIEVPARRGTVDSRYSRDFSQPGYLWPFAVLKDGRRVDVSRVDPDANRCDLHYLTDLGDGSVRFVDELNGLVSALRFPLDAMDNVWLFLAYGGWRGLYTAVVEPSTSYPYDLAQAIRDGHATVLEGGGKMSTKVVFRVDAISGRKARGKRDK